ncbi:ATP-grasp domain-containing protein [bacterium]|nr:ATP-grasp domain-containing protein [bacterium]
MKEIFAFIQNGGAQRIKWEIFNPKNNELNLWTDKKSLKELKKEKRDKLFKSITVTEDYSYPYLEESLKKVDKKPSNLWVATNEEYVVSVCADLRENLNLKGDYSLDKFRNKDLMKKQLISKGLEQYLPKYKVFDKNNYLKNPEEYLEEIVDYLSYPIIAKPTDLAGSKGVTLISNIEDLKSWVKDIIEDENQYELDDFIDGDLYHCDSIVQNGKIKKVLHSKYLKPCNSFHNAIPCASIVVPDHLKIKKTLDQLNEELLSVFSPLPDGTFHLELFMTKNGQSYFLEVAARSAGGLTPEVYEKTYGLDYRTLHYALQCRKNISLETKNGPYSAWAWIPKKKGKVVALNKPEHFLSEYQIEWNCEINENLEKPKGLLDYCGKLLLWSDDYQTLEKDFKTIENFNFLEVK